MANELIVTNAAALAALVDKITGDTLTATEYTTLKDSVQEANTATRTANTVFSGPTTGAAAAPTFRALVAADIPTGVPLANLAALTIDRALISSGAGVVSVSSVTATELGYVSGVTSAIQTQLGNKQPLDATLTALAALDATTGFVQQTGVDTFVKADLTAGQINTALTYTAADAANLNATNLTIGTVPDARFPATLPAASGANLTALNPANLSAAVPYTKGGTGLTALGTALQVLRTNAGATAVEWADASGGISGLTTNVIPVAGSATTIVNSKITMSGANLGTATLYDSTGGTGVSRLVVRAGPGQSTTPELAVLDSAGVSRFSFATNGYEMIIGNILVQGNTGWIATIGGGSIHASGWAEFYIRNPHIQWPGGTNTVGIKYDGSAGIIRVSNASTGYGRLVVGTLGVNNSAAGSTPGTCVKKIEVFDAAGASLGFVPVYDAIT